MSESRPGDGGTIAESPARRRVFFAIVLGAGGAIAASLGAALGLLSLAPLRGSRGAKSGRVDLGPLATFEGTQQGKAGPQEVVVSRTIEDGYMTRKAKERVVVVHDASSPDGLAVLATTCSHLGCGVSYNAARRQFLCPCHGGVYDEAGRVVGGPPPRPLARLPLIVEGGRLSLDLSKLDDGHA